MTSRDTQRYLAFSLSGERYAIPLLKTREVIPHAEATPVPFAPGYFKGVINLRGQVISVVDLRLKLQLPTAEIGPETAIIVIDLPPGCLGIIVDSVDAVLSMSASEIRPLALAQTLARHQCLLGVFQSRSELVFVLDLDKAIGEILNRAAA